MKPAGPKPNIAYTRQPRGSYIGGKTYKTNKKFYYTRGQSSENLTGGGFRPQGSQTAPPPPHMVPLNPGPQWGGGLGPRRGGDVN